MAKEKYQLKDGATVFYDDEIDLKIVAGQQVDIDEDEASPKTATALMSGGLVKVKTSRSSDEKKK